jgi:hypothetical protein
VAQEQFPECCHYAPPRVSRAYWWQDSNPGHKAEFEQRRLDGF